MACQKPAVGQDADRNAKCGFPAVHHLGHAPFAGLRQHNVLGLAPRQRPFHLARKRAAITRIVELHIIDTPAIVLQLLGEVTHRGEDKGDLLLVVRRIRRLFLHLGHEDDGVLP